MLVAKTYGYFISLLATLKIIPHLTHTPWYCPFWKHDSL